MRLRIRITGAVQGVGFRPHVYRLASEFGLTGWVLNSIQGVLIEAQGQHVHAFAENLRAHPPPHAVVRGFDVEEVAEAPESGFSVRASTAEGEPAAFLLPDLAICDACLKDIRDPANRRFRYPFTTCTHCGPRYSIVEGIPYDRPLTSMKRFAMCAACEREYRDPLDRRFHAQTNACPDCGPWLELWDPAGNTLASRHDALLGACNAVWDGRIVALKGLGGFHLVCRPEAAALLRARKRRPSKPFAVMAPTLAQARQLCRLDEAAEKLLSSPQSPIVLADRAQSCRLPDDVAPANPLVGLLLPYTPLHALLMDELAFPVIATSGNLTDDPISIDEREALARLRGVADLFLVHNRPILRPVDDSVVRFLGGAAVLMRRARGYAPLPLAVSKDLPELFATGAHMKNTVAFSRGRLVFVSQHLGDLETLAGLESHQRAALDFQRVYAVKPQAVAHDLHPDYGSTKTAREMGGTLKGVQHHEAHVLAAMAEHGLDAPVLGVAWDGAGYGPDGTVWGGEFLRFDGRKFERAARLRPFRLPGGEQAVREPRRSLLGVAHEMERPDLARPLFTGAEWKLVTAALARGLNSPWTTSAGRLFDAAAALLGLKAKASFEGEAAMELEFAARTGSAKWTGPAGPDWAHLIAALAGSALPLPDRAHLFHDALAAFIAAVAAEEGIKDVILTGGCFQNALLAELASNKLTQAGFRVWTHRAFPPNDGSIALGQILGAALEVS